jgi:predicted MFS family arabinose efflux permease
MVALPLLTISLTRNLLALAGVSAVIGISRAVSSLPGGVLVDRYNRRRIMVTCNFVSGMVLAALVLDMSLGAPTLPAVYAVAVVLPISDNIWDLALQAYTPELVSPAGLSTANGRLQGVDVTGEQFLGPAVGGLLFGAARRIPFLGDAISFAGSASLLLGLPDDRRRVVFADLTTAGAPAPSPARRPGAGLHARPGWSANLAEGLVAFRQERTIQLLALAVGWLSLCLYMVASLFVYYGTRVLHLSAAGYGLLLGLAALLGALASFGAGRFERRFGLSALILTGMVCVGVSYLGLSFTRSAPLAVFVLGLQELGMTLANVGFVTVRQRLVPKHVLGRVLGAYRLITACAIPLGAALASVVASRWSVTTNFAVAGVLELAALPVVLPPLLRRVRRQLPG